MFGHSSSIRGFILYVAVLVVAVSLQTALANDGKLGELHLLWFLFLTLIFHCPQPEYDDVKVKRGGTMGLFPFPRVGRSDPELSNSNWEPLLNSLEDYNGEWLKGGFNYCAWN